MQLRNAVDAFAAAFGIGATEATVYVHLCLEGPAKVGDLAASLKLHRNEVYRSAGRLLQRGLVERTLERPARVAALPPAAALDAEIASRLAGVDGLRRTRDEIAPLLAAPAARPAGGARVTYKVIQGRREILAARDHVAAQARSSMDWAATCPAALPEGSLDAIAARVAEGVRLRALLKAPATPWAALDALAARTGVELRELAVEGAVRFLIADGKELLMWVVHDPGASADGRREVAIHTTAPGLVQAERMFFDQAWSRAPPRVNGPDRAAPARRRPPGPSPAT